MREDERKRREDKAKKTRQDKEQEERAGRERPEACCVRPGKQLIFKIQEKRQRLFSVRRYRDG